MAIESVPIGRAMKASEKISERVERAFEPAANGKNTAGNTSTEAMP
jgi:hypothetical protein